jgi:hypothetical protein
MLLSLEIALSLNLPNFKNLYHFKIMLLQFWKIFAKISNSFGIQKFWCQQVKALAKD